MPAPEPESRRQAGRKVSPVLLFLGFFFLLDIAAWCLMRGVLPMRKPDGTPLGLVDQATILFGSATVALVVFSLVLAVVAVFGYETIKRSARQEIEESLKDRLAILEAEMRGRVLTTLGFVIGEISLTRDSLEALDRDRMEDAIRNSEKGYELLHKVGGPAEYMALNNLVYYLSLMGDQSRGDFILEKAQLLRKAGQEHDAPHLLLTYCKAVLEFGRDGEEKRAARRIAEAVAANPRLSDRKRNEAKSYLASFDQQGKSVPPEPRESS
jgi:hypothetical protein